MNKKKTITIEIDVDGTSTIDLDGFEGRGCEQALKDFRGSDKIVKSVTKPEFYRMQQTQQKVRNQQ
jgi:hypothetical protein